MIVDDEYNIREGLVNAVPWDSIGVRVVAQAQDGTEALDLARQSRPDVVITDISMDEMDGLEFAETLLAERPWTKVIILSGYSEFAYAQRAVSLRVWAYLLKPVGPEELLEKVAGAVQALELDRSRGRRWGEATVEADLPGRSVIRRAREYLDSQYHDHETSLESMADHLGLTPAYLSKLFKAETGQNYSDALAELRIEKAKDLLLSTNLKSADVGARVGYQNPQYFATAFKKATGVSPSEFREKAP